MRLAVAVLILAAVIAQFSSTVGEALAQGRHVPTVVANFFSFFTILSNVSSAVVLLVLGVRFFAGAGASRSIPAASRLRSPSCRRT